MADENPEYVCRILWAIDNDLRNANSNVEMVREYLSSRPGMLAPGNMPFKPTVDDIKSAIDDVMGRVIFESNDICGSYFDKFESERQRAIEIGRRQAEAAKYGGPPAYLIR